MMPSGPQPPREAAGRALIAVGVFAAVTIVVLIAALLYFAAKGS